MLSHGKDIPREERTPLRNLNKALPSSHSYPRDCGFWCFQSNSCVDRAAWVSYGVLSRHLFPGSDNAPSVSLGLNNELGYGVQC